MNKTKLVKITDDWVLNLNNYKVYKVEKDSKGNIISLEEACKLSETDNGIYECRRTLTMPIGIWRKAIEIANKVNYGSKLTD